MCDLPPKNKHLILAIKYYTSHNNISFVIAILDQFVKKNTAFNTNHSWYGKHYLSPFKHYVPIYKTILFLTI